MKKLIGICIITLLALSCQKENIKVETDLSDNEEVSEMGEKQNVFNLVTIGNQIWKLKNLNRVTYRNGDTIPRVTDPLQWANLSTGAWCYYENKGRNATTYGKLYNWYAVHDPRGLAPDGWHIPSSTDWEILLNYLGGASVAGGKMKDIIYWHSPNVGATNSSGFSGIPGGFRNFDGTFYSLGYSGNWWCANAFNTIKSRYLTLDYSHERADRDSYKKTYGFSVRCIKD